MFKKKINNERTILDTVINSESKRHPQKTVRNPPNRKREKGNIPIARFQTSVQRLDRKHLYPAVKERSKSGGLESHLFLQICLRIGFPYRLIPTGKGNLYCFLWVVVEIRCVGSNIAHHAWRAPKEGEWVPRIGSCQNISESEPTPVMERPQRGLDPADPSDARTNHQGSTDFSVRNRGQHAAWCRLRVPRCGHLPQEAWRQMTRAGPTAASSSSSSTVQSRHAVRCS